MIPAKSVSEHMMNIQLSEDSKKCPIFYKNDPDLICERIGMRSCYDVLDVVFFVSGISPINNNSRSI